VLVVNLQKLFYFNVLMRYQDAYELRCRRFESFRARHIKKRLTL